jgi:hypothetical protein
MAAPMQASFASQLPPAEQNVSQQLQQHTQEANEAEREALNEGLPQSGN